MDATLLTLSGTLVDRAASPGAQWEACRDLHSMLSDAAGWGPGMTPGPLEARTALPSGEAISPIEAAACLFDNFRTHAFTAAVVGAISDKRRAAPDRPVTVLYAGCGPFASLLLPAFSRFGPGELQCILLDVHDEALAAAQRVLTTFGLEGFVRRIEKADASAYRVRDRDVDVVVAECMRRGLTVEPQVAVTWNLATQLGPEVRWVPDEVWLRLVAGAFDDASVAPATPLTPLSGEPVFLLSPEAARAWGPFDPGQTSLPAARVVSAQAVYPPDRVGVATLLLVGETELGDHQSTLTTPVAIDVEVPVAAGAELAFEYRLDQPGLALARS